MTLESGAFIGQGRKSSQQQYSYVPLLAVSSGTEGPTGRVPIQARSHRR